jgi:AraC-like DNA-binding protein
MVNPGEMHDGRPLDRNPRSWKMLYFDPHLVAEELSEDVPVMSLTLQPRVHDGQQAALFGYLFRSLIEPHPDLLRQEVGLLTLLLYAFRQHSIQRRPTFEAATPDVAKIIGLIDSFPERAFTLAEMAIVAGHSRFQLLRGFRRATGVTPHAYILQRRVRLARRLLAAGKAPAEASIEAGFADQSHMTRAFTRQLGVTPARYRAVVYGPKRAAISFKT